MHANVPLLLDRDQIGFILNACIIHNLCIWMCYVLLMFFNACGYPILRKIVSIFLYMLRNFSLVCLVYSYFKILHKILQFQDSIIILAVYFFISIACKERGKNKNEKKKIHTVKGTIPSYLLCFFRQGDLPSQEPRKTRRARVVAALCFIRKTKP